MHGFFKRRQAGQAIVLVAAAVLVLTAILALAIDGGGIYLERRQLQNAADAGALAGAEKLWSSSPPNYAAMHTQALSTIGKNLGISTAGAVPTNTPSGGSPWSLSPNYVVTLQATTYTYRVTLQHTHPVVVAPIHGFASTLQLQVQATAQNENLPYAIVLLQSGAVPTYSNLQMSGNGTELNLSGPGGANPLDRGGIWSNASIDPGVGDIYFGPCTAGNTTAAGTSGDLSAVSETAADGGRASTEAFCGQTAPGSWLTPTSLIPDPRYPEPPAPNVTYNGATVVNGSNAVLCPGHYSNQIKIDGTAVLFPGVYRVDAGGVSVSGTLRTLVDSDLPVTCGSQTINTAGSYDPGVIIEVTPGNVSGATQCAKHLFTTIGGSSNVTLAPSPKYFDINLYIEEMPGWQTTCTAGPTGTNVVKITGGGFYSIQGIIYGPADNMQISGGGSGSGVGQVVAWTLGLNGGGAINELYNPSQLPYLKGLIQ
jgi:Flp pilus assembly protein TadG